MGRMLYFEQITDSRFDMDIEILLIKRIENLEKSLRLEGVEFSHSRPYRAEFDGFYQYRARCYVKKFTNKLTWSDIFRIINDINTVPYHFIENKYTKGEL